MNTPEIPHDARSLAILAGLCAAALFALYLSWKAVKLLTKLFFIIAALLAAIACWMHFYVHAF